MPSAEEIKTFFNDFSIENIGSVIILVIVLITLFVPIHKSFSNTFFEEFFIEPNKKGKYNFFKIIGFLIFLLPANFILSMYYGFLIIEFIITLISLLKYFIYT